MTGPDCMQFKPLANTAVWHSTALWKQYRRSALYSGLSSSVSVMVMIITTIMFERCAAGPKHNRADHRGFSAAVTHATPGAG